MTNNISINPALTTNAPGSFSTTTEGYVQGVALDDPSIRNSLAGGVLATSETLPMWGGVAIYENIPAVGSDVIGPQVGRATSLANLTGFSVLNQAVSWITSPQSQAPSVGASGFVPFYRLGSRARIPVAMDPSLISLDGGLITQNVSWDFLTQRLQPYDASTPTFALSSVTWSGGILTVVASAAVPYGVGDTVTISGATNSGTGGAAAINTSFVIATLTDSTHFTLFAPAAAGVFGTIAGSPIITAGTGALNVKVLSTQATGNKVIAYDAVNNFVNWNNNGAVAIILI